MSRHDPDFRTHTVAETLAILDAYLQRPSLGPAPEADDRAERDEAMSERDEDWLASKAEDAETRWHERQQESVDGRWSA